MPGRTPGEAIAGSCRDPAGHVFARDGRIVRAMDPACSDLLHGLADTLLPSVVDRKLIVPTAFVREPAPPAELLREEPIAGSTRALLFLRRRDEGF